MPCPLALRPSFFRKIAALGNRCEKAICDLRALGRGNNGLPSSPSEKKQLNRLSNISVAVDFTPLSAAVVIANKPVVDILLKRRRGPRQISCSTA